MKAQPPAGTGSPDDVGAPTLRGDVNRGTDGFTYAPITGVPHITHDFHACEQVLALAHIDQPAHWVLSSEIGLCEGLVDDTDAGERLVLSK